jgi:hypothetical protein
MVAPAGGVPTCIQSTVIGLADGADPGKMRPGIFGASDKQFKIGRDGRPKKAVIQLLRKRYLTT